MSDLKITIIDPVGKKAGLDHYDTSLANVLIKSSCSVTVFSNYDADQKNQNIRNHFRFKFHKGFFGFIFLFIEFIAALRIAKKEKSEIVILHIFHSQFADYLFILLIKYFRFRICLIVHDVESLVNQKSLSWIEKCIRRSELVVVHNTFSFDELVKKIESEDINKISVIPHGNFIDSCKEESRGESAIYFNLDNNKKYILLFGMLKKSKGIDLLIEAMKNVEPGVHLIIAGRTRDISVVHIEKIIKNLELSDRIHLFIRYLTNEERSKLFNLCEGVVLPYRKIYQSGVLLQAMSFGKPVITSDLPQNKMIINEENGLLFKSEDSKDLAVKINQLINDKALSESLAVNAKSYVEKNHNWENIGTAFFDILNK